mmetsp:Transcript_12809/g.19179  ORF Transcript_12809/g.19179 Transcript_12809/m.19179 type:complete len:88 (-) Transcript_12809:1644-1907(-)
MLVDIFTLCGYVRPQVSSELLFVLPFENVSIATRLHILCGNALFLVNIQFMSLSIVFCDLEYHPQKNTKQTQQQSISSHFTSFHLLF